MRETERDRENGNKDKDQEEFRISGKSTKELYNVVNRSFLIWSIPATFIQIVAKRNSGKLD